jgi:hypothetical protein
LRVETVRDLLVKDFGVRNARLLGSVTEDSIFADGAKAYKVFREEGASVSPETIAFLQDHLGATRDPPRRILPLEDV